MLSDPITVICGRGGVAFSAVVRSAQGVRQGATAGNSRIEGLCAPTLTGFRSHFCFCKCRLLEI